jgi:DNA-binding transcriptional LysR family regulator
VRSPPPPFSALRAVEAAFRHRSFTGAARELNVTHSAISQSVRRLESDLGAELFVRRGGGMQPSQAAKRLAAGYA